MNVLFCLTNCEVIQSEEIVTKKFKENQMFEKYEKTIITNRKRC